MTLDLELEAIEVNNEGFVLDGKSGIDHKRFLRVEYKNRNSTGNVDAHYKDWVVGTRLVVEAAVFWDTDRQGFYELHPDQTGQIATLRAGESGQTSGVVLWWRRLVR